MGKSIGTDESREKATYPSIMGLEKSRAFAISLIEILVALLQAYIFTMLSALYFGFASEEHEHAEAH